MRVLFLLFSLLFSLYANESNYSDENSYSDDSSQDIVENVLYVNYQDVPTRIFQGQIFPLTLKILSTVDGYTNLIYEFGDSVGTKLLNTTPISVKKNSYIYSTFYFLSTSNDLKTPDITISLNYNNIRTAHHKTIDGLTLNVTKLNPNSDFSNILAKKFTLESYKSTSYDNKNNIVVFAADAIESNLNTFHLKNRDNQGIETLNNDYLNAHLSYYVVMDKREKELNFSYFNTEYQKYETIYIPIIVNDDSVSTQSSIKPVDKGVNIFKIGAAIFVITLSFLLFIKYRKYIYIFIIIVAGAYIAYSYIPIKYICLKENSNIYLLPMKNSTIFDTTDVEKYLEVQGEIKEYTKVKLEENKIGWIDNENICVP